MKIIESPEELVLLVLIEDHFFRPSNKYCKHAKKKHAQPNNIIYNGYELSIFIFSAQGECCEQMCALACNFDAYICSDMTKGLLEWP